MWVSMLMNFKISLSKWFYNCSHRKVISSEFFLEGLMQSTHERKFLAFNVFKEVLAKIPKSQVRTLSLQMCPLSANWYYLRKWISLLHGFMGSYPWQILFQGGDIFVLVDIFTSSAIFFSKCEAICP